MYESTTIPNFYNLAMGDVTEHRYLDDQVVSNNGDRDQILTTVAQTLLLFFDQYPMAFVIFSGSTPERTRLYQIVINRERESVTDIFNFWGLNKNSQGDCMKR